MILTSMIELFLRLSQQHIQYMIYRLTLKDCALKCINSTLVNLPNILLFLNYKLSSLPSSKMKNIKIKKQNLKNFNNNLIIYHLFKFLNKVVCCL